MAVATASYAYLFGPLLKSVLAPDGQGAWGYSREELLRLLPWAMVLIAAVRALAQVLQTGVLGALAQKAMTRLRREVYGRVLVLPPGFFAQTHSGDVLTRFTSDVAQVEGALVQALTSYVRDTLQALALLGVCFVIDARLFLLTFIVLPAVILPVSRFAKAVKRIATRSNKSLASLTELISEQLQALPIVQAYRAEGAALARFDAEQARYLGAMRRSLFIRGAFTPVLEILGIAGVALAIGMGAQAVSAEPALAGKLLSFLAAALLLYQPLKAISGTLGQVVQGLASADRLYELSLAEPPRDGTGRAAALKARLELDSVQVSYGEDTRDALSGLTLTLEAGKRVALVGSSGAGKTTLVSLLLRLVDSKSGSVSWDGQELATLSRASVREHVAWVPQEPVLFSGTVRENLELAHPGAEESALWEALRLSHAEAFVRALPAGLDTEVGERGAQLSGGQRQRLAIARAFLKKPSVLILDEPTSALDAESERAVQAGLEALMKGRTTLVIAHRLSTVRDADVIHVLEAGRVIESGTHDALVAKQGRYAALLQQGELAAAA